MGRLAFVLFLALHKLGNKVREGARSDLHPKILQCLQRNNGWEPSVSDTFPCLSFPSVKYGLKPLRGVSLLLSRLGAP